MLKAVPGHPVLADVAIGLIAGLAATQLTNSAQRALKWATPESVELQERLVRPGASSSLVAAEKVTQQVGISPSRRQVESLGAAIHFGIGIVWGLVYGLLRRNVGFRPIVLKKARSCQRMGVRAIAAGALIPLQVEGAGTAWRVCGGSGPLRRGETRRERHRVLAIVVGLGRRSV